MGGMPGCPAKPTDLASRGTFKVPLIFYSGNILDAKYDLESVGRGYFLRFSGKNPLLAVNSGVGSA